MGCALCIDLEKIEQLKFYGYRVLEIIGRGAFGNVYWVLSLNESEYAMKVVVRGSGIAEDLLSWEMEMLNWISHPHIIEYKGAYNDNTFQCILLTVKEGGDLRVTLNSSIED